MATIAPADSIGFLKIIYYEYRTFLLNRKYYGHRLQRVRACNLTLEILIALGASSSTGVAGLTIWKQGAGITAWAIISSVSIVLAVIKPFINLPAQVERYGKLSGEFSTIYDTVRTIVQDCTAHKSLTSEQVQTFEQARKRSHELATLDDQNPSRKLIARLRQEVNTEIPVSSLWMPKISEPAKAS